MKKSLVLGVKFFHFFPIYIGAPTKQGASSDRWTDNRRMRRRSGDGQGTEHIHRTNQ